MRTKKKVEMHDRLGEGHPARKHYVRAVIHRGMRELLCNFILIGNDMYTLQLHMVVRALLRTISTTVIYGSDSSIFSESTP